MLRKFTYYLFTLFFLCNTLAFSKTWTVNSVPNPKKEYNTFVSNPDKIILPKTVDKINETLQELEDKTTTTCTVVLLKSIGNEVPKTFAVELFNKWSVEQNGNDNGLLVLLVLDQHRIEFETGYALKTILSDTQCDEIQQQQMLPYFKEKKYGMGMLKGIEKIAETLMLAQQNVSLENDSLSNKENTNQPAVPVVSKSTDDEPKPQESYKLKIYIVCIKLVTLIYLLFFVIAHFRKDYYAKYQTLRPFSLHIWWIVFPIPFSLFHFINQFYLQRWRNAPRNSSETGLPMHKLSEDEDDMYLQSGQITEETAKSLDYDVWVSGAPNDILILSYGPYLSIYSKCPNCNFRAYHQVYDRVITSATYTSSGVGERKHECKHCHHVVISRYTIPRKIRSKRRHF